MLDNMAQRLAHRGPDGQGRHVAGNLGLVHTRLSIIDLAGGNQPLYTRDRQLCVVANGEIYNHIELRATLEARGHVFSTHSDCETILHAYREYGDDFVRHLFGMFAFALYDVTRDRLLLARDRLGIKPLFIRADSAGVVFRLRNQIAVAGRRDPHASSPTRCCNISRAISSAVRAASSPASKKYCPASWWKCATAALPRAIATGN